MTHVSFSHRPPAAPPRRLRLAALGLLLAAAGAAQAQTPVTFTFTGGPQTYTVPRGVTRLQVVATGASGGSVPDFEFSRGGRVEATVAVTPGEVLTVRVGGQGLPKNRSTLYVYTGGFNGGGAGDNGNGTGGGGGGGATDLRRTGPGTGDYLASRNALVVAGGGGGSCGDVAGARGGDGGGPDGGDGGNLYNGGSPGRGATQAAPGAGTDGAASGSNGTGGDGGTSDNEGGGGGGGYYGGGGGSSNFGDGPGPGGGGSSWAMPGSNPTYDVSDAGGDGELTITPIPGGPLPVQLASFTATAQGRTARLAWITASEKNSARFEVERSDDGKTFVKIGEVAAAGSSSSARHYQHLDAAAPAGRLYYRLRQVDLDGTAAYSPVQTVALGTGAALALYPNPAHGPATVSGLPAGTTVQVLDLQGRPVLAARADEAGQATLALPATLAPGLYLVRGGTHTARLLVE